MPQSANGSALLSQPPLLDSSATLNPNPAPYTDAEHTTKLIIGGSTPKLWETRHTTPRETLPVTLNSRDKSMNLLLPDPKRAPSDSSIIHREELPYKTTAPSLRNLGSAASDKRALPSEPIRSVLCRVILSDERLRTRKELWRFQQQRNRLSRLPKLILLNIMAATASEFLDQLEKQLAHQLSFHGRLNGVLVADGKALFKQNPAPKDDSDDTAIDWSFLARDAPVDNEGKGKPEQVAASPSPAALDIFDSETLTSIIDPHPQVRRPRQFQQDWSLVPSELAVIPMYEVRMLRFVVTIINRPPASVIELFQSSESVAEQRAGASTGGDGSSQKETTPSDPTEWEVSSPPTRQLRCSAFADSLLSVRRSLSAAAHCEVLPFQLFFFNPKPQQSASALLHDSSYEPVGHVAQLSGFSYLLVNQCQQLDLVSEAAVPPSPGAESSSALAEESNLDQPIGAIPFFRIHPQDVAFDELNLHGDDDSVRGAGPNLGFTVPQSDPSPAQRGEWGSSRSREFFEARRKRNPDAGAGAEGAPRKPSNRLFRFAVPRRMQTPPIPLGLTSQLKEGVEAESLDRDRVRQHREEGDDAGSGHMSVLPPPRDPSPPRTPLELYRSVQLEAQSRFPQFLPNGRLNGLPVFRSPASESTPHPATPYQLSQLGSVGTARTAFPKYEQRRYLIQAAMTIVRTLDDHVFVSSSNLVRVTTDSVQAFTNGYASGVPILFPLSRTDSETLTRLCRSRLALELAATGKQVRSTPNNNAPGPVHASVGAPKEKYGELQATRDMNHEARSPSLPWASSSNVSAPPNFLETEVDESPNHLSGRSQSVPLSAAQQVLDKRRFEEADPIPAESESTKPDGLLMRNSAALASLLALTKPQLHPSTGRMQIFATCGVDIFSLKVGGGNSSPGAAGAPTAPSTGAAPPPPFRWYLERRSDRGEFGNRYQEVALDAMIALGVARTFVLSHVPPITVGLELDLRRQEDAEDEEGNPAQSARSSTRMLLQPGIQYVIGIVVHFRLPRGMKAYPGGVHRSVGVGLGNGQEGEEDDMTLHESTTFIIPSVF